MSFASGGLIAINLVLQIQDKKQGQHGYQGTKLPAEPCRLVETLLKCVPVSGSAWFAAQIWRVLIFVGGVVVAGVSAGLTLDSMVLVRRGSIVLAIAGNPS